MQTRGREGGRRGAGANTRSLFFFPLMIFATTPRVCARSSNIAHTQTEAKKQTNTDTNTNTNMHKYKAPTERERARGTARGWEAVIAVHVLSYRYLCNARDAGRATLLQGRGTGVSTRSSSPVCRSLYHTVDIQTKQRGTERNRTKLK